MLPLRIEGANVIFKGPEGVSDLHVMVVDGCCVSRWELTPHELELLNRGGSVELMVVGIQPIVSLSVSEPAIAVEEVDE
jgi:hypothetical protein